MGGGVMLLGGGASTKWNPRVSTLAGQHRVLLDGGTWSVDTNVKAGGACDDAAAAAPMARKAANLAVATRILPLSDGACEALCIRLYEYEEENIFHLSILV